MRALPTAHTVSALRSGADADLAAQQASGWKEMRMRRTFRVFSNWLLMRVIMPSAAMNDSRDSTCQRLLL